MYFIVTKEDDKTGFKVLTPGELRELVLSEAPVATCVDDFYISGSTCVIIKGDIVVPEIKILVRTVDGEPFPM